MGHANARVSFAADTFPLPRAPASSSNNSTVPPVTAPAFVVDPINGNDITGTGLPGNPVKTAARLYAIWSGIAGNKPHLIPTGGTCTVTFTSAPPPSDPIGILANIIIEGLLLVVGPAATVNASDTIGAIVTSLNRGQGTAAPWTISGTGILNFAPFVDHMFVDTTLGTVAWVAAAVGANAQLTQVCAALVSPFFTLPIPIPPAATNAFQLVSLPTAAFDADVYAQSSSFGAIVFYRWDYTNTFVTSIVDTDRNCSVAFAECRVDDSMQWRGSVFGLNTWFTRAPEFASVSASPFTPAGLAGGSVGGLVMNGGSLDGDFYLRDGNFNIDAGMVIEGHATLGLVGFFTTIALQQQAIEVGPNGNVTQRSLFYGANAVYGTLNTAPPDITRCIGIQPGGVYQYSAPATTAIGFSTTTPIVVGNNVSIANPAIPEFTGGYTVAQLGTANAIFDRATGAYLGPITAQPSGFQPIVQVIGGPGVYGDGSDGVALFSNPVGPVPAGAVQDSAVPPVFHLTRDVFWTSCNIENGVVLNTNGFKIHCTGQFLATITLATLIQNNGFPGVANVAGAGALTGSIAGGTAGGAGGAGGSGAGAPGTNVTQGVPQAASLATGGPGGAGGGAAGPGGTYTSVLGGGMAHALPEVGFWAVPQITGTALALVPLQGGAGGGGGGGGASTGGGGGGGGGTVWIAAPIICVFGGVLAAKGGDGGNGTAGAGGEGGGGGGGGGTIVLVGAQMIVTSTDVSGGAGGAGASGGAGGTAGTPGNVFQFFMQ